mmetsp:Transcript_9685/g.21501  ORF Transcript_9685/g.21501 Transcript_9685/m.21501 type:complete len:218 (+) Transcript_9685:472-1125(+)
MHLPFLRMGQLPPCVSSQCEHRRVRYLRSQEDFSRCEARAFLPPPAPVEAPAMPATADPSTQSAAPRHQPVRLSELARLLPCHTTTSRASSGAETAVAAGTAAGAGASVEADGGARAKLLAASAVGAAKAGVGAGMDGDESGDMSGSGEAWRGGTLTLALLTTQSSDPSTSTSPPPAPAPLPGAPSLGPPCTALRTLRRRAAEVLCTNAAKSGSPAR